MYYRLAAPGNSPFEPRRLYNVSDFLMFDEDKSGTIDKDEAVRAPPALVRIRPRPLGRRRWPPVNGCARARAHSLGRGRRQVRIFRRRFGKEGAEAARKAMWEANEPQPGDVPGEDNTQISFSEFLKWDRKILKVQLGNSPRLAKLQQHAKPVRDSVRILAGHGRHTAVFCKTVATPRR